MDMPLHEGWHVVGYALRYVWLGVQAPVKWQGIISTPKNGMMLPDGRGQHFFGTALPIFVDKVAEEYGSDRDDCVSRADRADALLFERDATDEERRFLPYFARLCFRHGYTRQIAAHLPEDCGGARIDMQALCDELRPEIEWLRPQLGLPDFALRSMVDKRPFRRLRSKFEALKISAPHKEELRLMAVAGRVTNLAHTQEWFAEREPLPMRWQKRGVA
ncbi:hypothetical protein LCM28_05605 [Salipiger pacificus]|nr:hypothetical protein [Alloyangia pacifica]